MIKKYLCVGTLVVSLILQSVPIFSVENIDPSDTRIVHSETSINTAEAAMQADSTEQEQSMTPEELKIQQEQLIKDQEQLKKDQEQLKSDQEILKQEREQLEKDRAQFQKDLDQIKKEQEKKEIQDKQNKLTSEINSSTYLKYIKDLGYYKKVYSNDEKLNIRNAVLLFQSNHNMSVTGKYDDATKAMLVSRLSSKEFVYLDTVNKAPTDGKWIVVNKTKRTLTLYEGTKVLKKYAVAVGNPSSLTKSGKFIINMKLIDPAWGGGGFAKPVKGGVPENPLGNRWLGINRTDGSYGIHGTNSFYSIGTYASHGCIRMQNYCVEELYPLVPMKANVWVGTQDELLKWGITQNPFTTQTSSKK